MTNVGHDEYRWIADDYWRGEDGCPMKDVGQDGGKDDA
jgi:hypothetical protein